MAPRNRSVSSNCFSNEYAGDAYNGEADIDDLAAAEELNDIAGAGVDTLNHQSSLSPTFPFSSASAATDDEKCVSSTIDWLNSNSFSSSDDDDANVSSSPSS
ncbi:unnamed protein product [Bathycoccus prasinos]